MRNLKKVLSLALALVMLLGMMVVGAGAAETKFPDDSKIENKEAVAVANAIGVLLGDENGNFNPDGTLNRAQAAVVIAKLDLGGSAAGALTATGASKFIDVGPSFAWAQPYIDYCAGRELIVGDGTGKFLPGKNVTGVEFAIMVSKVLGYDAKAENLGGSDWNLKGAALAQKAGLTYGVAASTKDMTRDDMAQMVLNALVANTVEYPNGTGMDITVGSGTVSIGAGKAQPKKHVSSKADKLDSTYDRNTVSDLYNWKLCEEKYPELKLRSDEDSFRRPIQVWSYGRKDVFDKTVDTVAVYHEPVKGTKIASDLGVSKATKSVVYTDGKPDTAKSLDSQGDNIGGNGVLTQAWIESDNTVKITCINTYVGTVASLNKAGDTISVAGLTKPADNKDPSGTYGVEGFEVGDLVMYTAAWDGKKAYGIESVKPLGDPATTGALVEWKGYGASSNNKADQNDNFTVDATKYEYSRNAYVGDNGGGIWSYALKTELSVYVDDYGYALYVVRVAKADNYAAVIGVGDTNAFGSRSNGCTLLFPDGTIKEVKYTLPSANGTLSTKSNSTKQDVSDMIGDVVTYTVNSDDVYTLNVVDNWDTAVGTTVDSNPSAGNTYFKNGASVLYINGTKYYTTSKTIFMVAAGVDGKLGYENYKVYTGYKEMPSFNAASGYHITGVAFKTNSTYGNQIDVIYIGAPGLADAAGVDTYFVKNTGSRTVSASDGDYYVLDAVVDGELTTVKVSINAEVKNAGSGYSFKADEGLFAISEVAVNSNGVIIRFKDETVGGLGATAFKASNVTDNHTSATKGIVRDPTDPRTVLGIGGDKDSAVYWAYTDKTKVYLVDKYFSEITESAPAAVVTDDNDMIYAALDSKGATLTNVFIVKQDPPDNGGGSGSSDKIITTEPTVETTQVGDVITINVPLVDVKTAEIPQTVTRVVSNELNDLGYIPSTPYSVATTSTAAGSASFLAMKTEGARLATVNVTWANWYTVKVDSDTEYVLYNTAAKTKIKDVEGDYAGYIRTDYTKGGVYGGVTSTTNNKVTYTDYATTDTTIEANVKTPIEIKTGYVVADKSNVMDYTTVNDCTGTHKGTAAIAVSGLTAVDTDGDGGNTGDLCFFKGSDGFTVAFTGPATNTSGAHKVTLTAVVSGGASQPTISVPAKEFTADAFNAGSAAHTFTVKGNFVTGNNVASIACDLVDPPARLNIKGAGGDTLTSNNFKVSGVKIGDVALTDTNGFTFDSGSDVDVTMKIAGPAVKTGGATVTVTLTGTTQTRIGWSNLPEGVTVSSGNKVLTFQVGREFAEREITMKLTNVTTGGTIKIEVDNT